MELLKEIPIRTNYKLLLIDIRTLLDIFKKECVFRGVYEDNSIYEVMGVPIYVDEISLINNPNKTSELDDIYNVVILKTLETVLERVAGGGTRMYGRHGVGWNATRVAGHWDVISRSMVPAMSVELERILYEKYITGEVLINSSVVVVGPSLHIYLPA